MVQIIYGQYWKTEEDKTADERKEEIKLGTELLRYLVLAGITTGGGVA